MIEVFHITSDSGVYDTHYRYNVCSFSSLDLAERFLEENCVLMGQDMQDKYGEDGEDGHNYLYWKPKVDCGAEFETWEITYEIVYESWEEMIIQIQVEQEG